MHIGKFFPPFSGGMENFMHDLAAASAALGVEQACLVHASGHPDEADARFEFLTELKRVPVATELSYAPIAPGFARALDDMIERFRPDLLHIHLPNTSAFFALFSRRARALPWLLHWHSDVVGPGLDVKLKLLYPAYWPFEQWLLRRAEAIVATSPPYLESSRALARWQPRTRVIALGLDAARIETASGPDPWGSSERLRVLGLGRLSRYKGFDTLIDAACEVEGVELSIVGGGSERARLQRRIPAERADRIRLVGAVDNDLRNRYLAGCDLLCMPSINRAEAFGLALVEAMAAGKPKIATRVPGSGMDWVVEEGRTGWMVEPRNPTALAELLRRLERDRGSVREYGRAAREQFEQRFRIDAVARQVVALYRKLMN
ncbi:MAG: glycosyltransferase [Wenzhouxiangellaceae bacterium]|nr:glycosyltransferase [Wenzhouxiangellaceae bacterium]